MRYYRYRIFLIDPVSHCVRISPVHDFHFVIESFVVLWICSFFNLCFSMVMFGEVTCSMILKFITANAGSSTPTESATNGSSQVEPRVKTTPGLVKAVCWLMVNLLALSPDDAVQHINRFGLVRLLFR